MTRVSARNPLAAAASAGTRARHNARAAAFAPVTSFVSSARATLLMAGNSRFHSAAASMRTGLSAIHSMRAPARTIATPSDASGPNRPSTARSRRKPSAAASASAPSRTAPIWPAHCRAVSIQRWISGCVSSSDASHSPPASRNRPHCTRSQPMARPMSRTAARRSRMATSSASTICGRISTASACRRSISGCKTGSRASPTVWPRKETERRMAVILSV